MPPNRTVALLIRLTALAATIPASAATAPAPAASPPTESASAGSTEEALVLSPFSVTASSDVGYAATSTLGGTRLKSELRDVASQIDVMTVSWAIGTRRFPLRTSPRIRSSAHRDFSPLGPASLSPTHRGRSEAAPL
jgi:hypothetical protein